MPRVLSIHEYLLRPDADIAQFEKAIRDASDRGLLSLPGLVGHHFLRGIRGDRQGQYAAIWIYESRQAWERLWGPPERPRPRSDYPHGWRIWEDDVLAPFLRQDPGEIAFTAYEEL